MRLKLKLITSLSSTTAEEKDQFNLDPGTSHEICDVFLSGNARQYRIATGVTDQEVDFSGATSPQFVVIKTDKQISIKIDAGQAIPIKPPDGFDYGYFMLSTDDIDTLTITNASGYTATVKVYMAGDPS